jgi:hypothetical protein
MICDPKDHRLALGAAVLLDAALDAKASDPAAQAALEKARLDVAGLLEEYANTLKENV